MWLCFLNVSIIYRVLNRSFGHETLPLFYIYYPPSISRDIVCRRDRVEKISVKKGNVFWPKGRLST